MSEPLNIISCIQLAYREGFYSMPRDATQELNDLSFQLTTAVRERDEALAECENLRDIIASMRSRAEPGERLTLEQFREAHGLKTPTPPARSEP